MDPDGSARRAARDRWTGRPGSAPVGERRGVGGSGQNEPVTTALELAINALSEPKTSVADAFRALVVVSRRLGADDLSRWLHAELHGYTEEMDVAEYRNATALPIELHFDGPMRTWQKMHLSPNDLPEELGHSLSKYALRAPIAELEALVAGNEDPQMPLPPSWVELYRHFMEKGQVPHPSMMILNRAALTMPATYLSGIIDRIKTAALDLALSLEDVSPEAGSLGGPKVADTPGLAETLTVHLTQILGDNSAVAIGSGARVITTTTGDVGVVLTRASDFLSASGVEVFRQALAEDGDEPGVNTRHFLQKVKNSGVDLAVGIASSGAYEGLLALLHQAFPGFRG
jgi:hypothetical protein